METFLSVIFLNIALRVTVLSSPNEQFFEVLKFYAVIIILRYHHPHDKLKHSSHFFSLNARARFSRLIPREIDILHVYTYTYISRTGWTVQPLPRAFFFSAKSAFVVRAVRRVEATIAIS